jgi:hypothetical protein
MRVLAIKDLAALIAARGVVLLTEGCDEQLEAGVAAAARDVCLRDAVVLDAEEGVRVEGHLALGGYRM